eukprot:1310381-Rhodomonas_salina.5
MCRSVLPVRNNCVSPVVPVCHQVRVYLRRSLCAMKSLSFDELRLHRLEVTKLIPIILSEVDAQTSDVLNILMPYSTSGAANNDLNDSRPIVI